MELGRYYLNSGTPEKRSVTQVVMHPNYNPSTTDNDVCLLYLDAKTTKPTIKLAAGEGRWHWLI